VIAESLTLKLTGTLVVSGGMDESLTMTEKPYVPPVAGMPES
jgi:hypothetical protein